MKILVAVATKHGATREIAEEITATLVGRGFDARLSECEALDSVEDFDAVVLGSAVYAGHWRSEARAFAERHARELESTPVWLFSSGPLGDPPQPLEEPVEVRHVMDMTGARDHRVFAGRLHRDELSLPERAVVKMVRAPEGDFRPWTEIRDWAGSIAEALADRVLPVPAVGPDDGKLPPHRDHELRPD